MLSLFESRTIPLAVMMSLPLGVIGTLGAMVLTATNFTLFPCGRPRCFVAADAPFAEPAIAFDDREGVSPDERCH
jgi:hypothetical protein